MIVISSKGSSRRSNSGSSCSNGWSGTGRGSHSPSGGLVVILVIVTQVYYKESCILAMQLVMDKVKVIIWIPV